MSLAPVDGHRRARAPQGVEPARRPAPARWAVQRTAAAGGAAGSLECTVAGLNHILPLSHKSNRLPLIYT